jgi:hypothetical protein
MSEPAPSNEKICLCLKLQGEKFEIRSHSSNIATMSGLPCLAAFPVLLPLRGVALESEEAVCSEAEAWLAWAFFSFIFSMMARILARSWKRKSLTIPHLWPSFCSPLAVGIVVRACARLSGCWRRNDCQPSPGGCGGFSLKEEDPAELAELHAGPSLVAGLHPCSPWETSLNDISGWLLLRGSQVLFVPARGPGPSHPPPSSTESSRPGRGIFSISSMSLSSSRDLAHTAVQCHLHLPK